LQISGSEIFETTQRRQVGGFLTLGDPHLDHHRQLGGEAQTKTAITSLVSMQEDQKWQGHGETSGFVLQHKD